MEKNAGLCKKSAITETQLAQNNQGWNLLQAGNSITPVEQLLGF